MPLPLFYSKAPVQAEFITLDEDTSRHVVQVLRMKTGEQLELTDGLGASAITSIVEDHKRNCSVRVVERAFHPKSPRNISIAISLLKNSTRFEWFLEKATEIGVSDIVPMLCDRTEKQHFRLERMQTIVVSAMLQSRQYWLPRLNEITPFRQVVAAAKYPVRLIAHCENETRKHIGEFPTDACQVLIGPEGDFRRSEIELARQHGYEPCVLGDTRLRSETAGIVAATILCIC
ncbi:16S rRNA (uracil(1498)-N(3))-methyltransferase [Segetibacter sp. 3557_3]|uniref:RsmE family RNA methyltransferase n=1 Tax=Segetibacter sp. 3557_3 TaxID=2547429 RepID=UPI0010589B98|nr:RsmE family RNA methyltransferase [Segetibacter sp. 3557_3]TDH19807.1 16S rRNA (uracil(1498)-N(3))-methyltransferase [Segetibacter sp. 3557_3]